MEYVTKYPKTISIVNGEDKEIHPYLFTEIGYSKAVFTKDWKYIAV